MKQGGLLGKKLGMTQIFAESGDVIPVTVIEAGPCTVVQKKVKEREGYSAIQLGFSERDEKRLSKPMKGHFAKKGLKNGFRFLKEFRVQDNDKFQEGQVLTLGSFKVGDRVDISGISKGKGFQGVIKRHHKAGGPGSHGSHFHRGTGSIGQRTSPGEVFKNMKMPGHMGAEKVTSQGLLVAHIEPKDNILMVRGAVVGSNGSLLVIYNRSTDYESRFEKPKVEEKKSEEKKADEKKENI